MMEVGIDDLSDLSKVWSIHTRTSTKTGARHASCTILVQRAHTTNNSQDHTFSKKKTVAMSGGPKKVKSRPFYKPPPKPVWSRVPQGTKTRPLQVASTKKSIRGSQSGLGRFMSREAAPNFFRSDPQSGRKPGRYKPIP